MRKYLMGILITVMMIPSVSAAGYARITFIIGKVEVQRGSSSSWRSARLNMPVREKHVIRTFIESSADIELENGTKIKIGEQSVVSLSQLFTDSVSGSSKVKVTVRTGSLWGNLKKLTDSRSKFDFETPTAVASIRGTRLGIMVDKRRTTIDVYEGLVAVRKKGGRKPVNISANTRAVIGKDEQDEVTVVKFKEVKTQQDSEDIVIPKDPFVADTTYKDTISGSAEPPAKTSDTEEDRVSDTLKPAELPNDESTVGSEQDESYNKEDISSQKLTLTVTSPSNGMVLNEPLIVVEGRTLSSANVFIDNQQVSVSSNGSFVHRLPIPYESYTYTIEIKAEMNGQEVRQIREVTYSVKKEKLFLECALPKDGAVVTGRNLRVAGRTVSGATVTINGKTVGVATNGYYSIDIPLTEGNIGEYPLEISARNDEEEMVINRTVEISATSNLINTSKPVIIFGYSGKQAIAQDFITVLVLDRTPMDEITITVTNNGSTDIYTTSSGKTEKIPLDEGLNKYSIQAKDMAGNTAPVIKGNIYYLPGPLKLLLNEPSSEYVVYDGLPPVLYPGYASNGEALDVEIEIEDQIGTVPESIRYCKVTGNGKTVILRNNNDYIYKGQVEVKRGTNIFIVQVEDLTGKFETLKFTVVLK